MTSQEYDMARDIFIRVVAHDGCMKETDTWPELATVCLNAAHGFYERRHTIRVDTGEPNANDH